MPVAKQLRTDEGCKNARLYAKNIFMGATHTHSAPSINVSKEWDQLLMDSFVKAGKDAMADLAPVQLQATTATLENMNFVRHYLMNDGTYYGSNFGSTASGFKARALDPDKQLILVKRAPIFLVE